MINILFCQIYFYFYILGDLGVWGLKKNFVLLELLERLQNGYIGQYGVVEEVIGIFGEVLIEFGEIFVISMSFFF